MESHVGHSMRERSPDKLLECGPQMDGLESQTKVKETEQAQTGGHDLSEVNQNDEILIWFRQFWRHRLASKFMYRCLAWLTLRNTNASEVSWPVEDGKRRELFRHRVVRWSKHKKIIESRQNEEHDERSWCHRHNARNHNVRWKEWERVKRKKRVYEIRLPHFWTNAH